MLPGAPSPMPPDPSGDQPFLSKVMGDPWFRLGMALLEQGGPSPKPHSVGQDISRAVGAVQGQQDDDVARQMNGMKLQQAQQSQAFGQQALKGLMGGQQAQPLTPPPVAQMIAPGAGPSLPQARPQAPQGGQYDTLIEKAAKTAGLDPRLFRSLVESESGFNHFNPKNPQQIYTSNKGAMGLAQLMPGTAKDLGVDPNDPEQNLMGGARYLAQMRNKFGNDFDALRAYNAGPGNASMSKTISTEYANKILERLGANQSAPTGAPMPAEAPQGGQAPRTYSAPPPVPPELHRMFLAQAYAEGGGDVVQTVQSYYKLASAWQSQQMQSSTKFDQETGMADYKAGLDRETNTLKAKSEADMADNKAFQEGIGKTFAEQYGNIYKSGQSAAANIDRYRTLGSLLDRVYTGKFGGTAKDLVKLGQSIGIDGLNEQAAASDVAEAIINNMALSFRSTANGEGMPGAMSEGDRNFLMSLPPGFEKTPAGNKLLIEFYVRQEKRKQEVSRMARNYRKAHDGQFDDGFDDEMNSYMEAHPLFADGEIPKMLGAQANPDHVKRLKANPTPEMKKFFDEAYGAGAADRALKGK